MATDLETIIGDIDMTEIDSISTKHYVTSFSKFEDGDILYADQVNGILKMLTYLESQISELKKYCKNDIFIPGDTELLYEDSIYYTSTGEDVYYSTDDAYYSEET